MPTTAHRVSAGERINAHERPGRLQAALEKRGVRLTRQRKVLLQVMDNAELTFPFDSMTEFSDMETGLKTTVSPEGIRATYMSELKKFLSTIEKGCADVRADYKLFNTSQPLELALSEYLYFRSKMGT